MSDETPQPAPAQVDITQQVTAPVPRTSVKNPKRVAAGKMVAERTRLARKAQKKKTEEAMAQLAAQKENVSTSSDSGSGGFSMSSLSFNQWLMVGSLAVSLIGLLKKDEVIAYFQSKKKTTPEQQPASESTNQLFSPARPETPARKSRLKHME